MVYDGEANSFSPFYSFETKYRVKLLEVNVKKGIRRNKKNGCVPTIMRFEFDVVFALSHSMVKIRKNCPEQMIFYVTEGRAWNLKSSREEVFKDYSMG